jgi:methionyl-tRNA formyltransferase
MAEKPARVLKVAFLGTGGDYTLRPLLRVAARHEVVALVESAHRQPGPLDRSLELWRTLFGRASLWTLARRWRLPYFTYTRESWSGLPEFLSRTGAEVGCIASFGHLLPQEVIDCLPLGFINLHPSLLPEYRGPHVWFWYYHDCVRRGGVTVHRVEAGEDTGDILNQVAIETQDMMPPEDLMAKAIHLGSDLMVRTLDELAAGTVQARVQRHQPCPRRGSRVRPDVAYFNWKAWPIERCAHFLSGVYPWYDALKATHPVLGCLRWRAVGWQREANSPAQHGRLRLDLRGVHFVHPEGRIHLRPAISLWPVLVWALFGLLVVWQLLRPDT